MRLEQPSWWDIPEIWPEIAPLVERSLSHAARLYYPKDIRDALMFQKMKLWLAYEMGKLKAFAVTQLDAYPRLKSCSVIIIAGEDMGAWLHFHEAIEKYAKERGCEAVEGFGREGWKKMVKPLGYEVATVIYRKAL